MDKGEVEWWKFPKWTDEYEKGTDRYIDKAFATKCQGNQIQCPCNTCHYRYWRYRNVEKDHIICNGFVPRTKDFLDVEMGVEKEREVYEQTESLCMNDGIQELLHDSFKEGPNEEAKKFLQLIEEGQEELYPGCTTFSKLSFTMRLFIIYKCDYRLNNVQFGGLLQVFREVLPEIKLPHHFMKLIKF